MCVCGIVNGRAAIDGRARTFCSKRMPFIGIRTHCVRIYDDDDDDGHIDEGIGITSLADFEKTNETEEIDSGQGIDSSAVLCH